MPLGKRERQNIQGNTAKSPRERPLGLFYAVLGGWLIPKAGYRLLSVQPFAYVVGNYTCHNGD